MADMIARKVLSGADSFGDRRSLGISLINFKLASTDGGGLFILENVFHAKGGPAKHFHYGQDEWFYCIEGSFLFEIGNERITLQPGDSVLGPKTIPHVWAHIGDKTGRILIAFSPAGKMEDFFREVTKSSAMPAQDPDLWRAHGMELVGPPLPVP